MSIIQTSGRFRGEEIVDARRNHLEPDELKAFFKVLEHDPFWYGYFSLQYYYGCRVSEIAILLVEDVSFKTSEVIIKRLKKPRYPKKTIKLENGKTRKVPDKSVEPLPGFREQVYGMPEKLAEALGNVPHAVKGNPWFFCSPRRSRKGSATERMSEIRRTGGYSAISRSAAAVRFSAAAKQAGIPPRLAHSHVLRHTRATLLLAAGSAEEDVKLLLDHASIATTRMYLGVAKALRLRLQTAEQLGLADFLD